MDLTPREFELLLCEFCKQDLPPHFAVEHDIKEIGEESGHKRQIDTKIKGRLGVSDILICGEAKNWNEEVGSETIDALVGKYMSGEIRANKVILFSNGGFSKPAITRAKILGIELLEPEDIVVPIKPIPYIIAVGYLGFMMAKTWYLGPQQNLVATNPDDYIILKGEERITFHQNAFRIVVSTLRTIKNKNLDTDLSKLAIKDNNVLYELIQKEGFRYNANFEIEVSLLWEYISESFPAGILRHVNTGDIKFVNLQGHITEIISKVLLSPTKKFHPGREECIMEIKAAKGYLLHFCMSDPDRNRTNPQEPLFDYV